ncbi:MAG TPA: diadenylate cyclase CdaA [Phycisphaerales bacterium]|nr:diadenylate cyclase CdaA [Phycisphaerales bacterium]
MNIRLAQLFHRLSEYPWWDIALELALLWLIVYMVMKFVQGTRAAGALKGTLVIVIVGTLVFRVFAPGAVFARLAYLYENFLGFFAIALVVVFQPELRRALIRIGETPLFSSRSTDMKPVIEAIVTAASFLSKSKFGGLIAVERKVGLRDAIETGRRLNADVSSYLLTSIFWPSNPLHDMGVVIRGGRVVAACVQFPLAEPTEFADVQLGTRHRAAVGLARVSDAVVIVISEETGAISIAEGRHFRRNLTADELRDQLHRLLSPGKMPVTVPSASASPEMQLAATSSTGAESSAGMGGRSSDV